MKKIISIVLIILLTLTCFSSIFAATPEDVAGYSFEEAVSTLTSLGIVNGYKDGTFRPDQFVTRAQMAKILVIASGYEDVIIGSNSNFSDIKDHWAEEYISFAASIGLITGYANNTFRPDDKVTYDEAITMAIRALGYNDSSLKGIWPINYKLKAHDLGVLHLVDTSGDFADRGNIAQLMYNTLKKVYGHTDKSGNFSFSEGNKTLMSKLAEEETILLKYDNIYGDEKLKTLIDLEDYLFQNVIIYKNEMDEVIHVEKLDSNILIGRTTATSTSTKVEIEIEGTGVYEEIPLDSNVRTLYNGFDAGSNNHDNIGSGAVIDVIWRDKNSNENIDEGEVDGLVIEKLDNKFVVTEEFNENNFTIKGRKNYANSSYVTINVPTVTNDEDKEIVDESSIIFTGDAENIEQIAINDVLYIYSSRDNSKINFKAIKNTKTGIIDEILSSGSSATYVVIDGEQIKLASGFEGPDSRYYNRWAVNPESTQDKFLPGAEVVVLLDNVSYVYSYYLLEEAEGSKEIGLVLQVKDGKIVEEENGFIGDYDDITLPQIQVINKDGTVKIYDICDDVDVVSKGSAVYDSSSSITTTALNINNIEQKDIVEYYVNQENQITKIDTKNLDIDLENVEINVKSLIVDSSYLINDMTTIYSVVGQPENWEILEKEHLKDRITGSAISFEDEDALEVLLIAEGIESQSEEGVFALIQSISYVADNEGQEVGKIRVFENGSTKVYYTSSDDSRILAGEENEFLELEFTDNDITGVKQISYSSPTVESTLVLSEISKASIENHLIKAGDKYHKISESAMIYKLIYDNGDLEEIIIGDENDLETGALVRGYDLTLDNIDQLTTLFVISEKDSGTSDLPSFMIYNLTKGEGTESDPFVIETVEQLQNISNNLDCYYVQGADIDLSLIDNWTPIGEYGNPFTGSYDGNGFKISNMSIDTNSNYAGLFGLIDSGEISNIKLENVDVSGVEYVGGLAGKFDNETTVEECYTTGNINGTARVGGLVGVNEDGSTITECYSSANVVGEERVGGLVGYNYAGSSSPTPKVEASYATGNVTGSEEYIGGLIGRNYRAIVSQSYAEGDVTGTNADSEKIGGLIGHLRYSQSQVTNCYATGDASGFKEIGGLVGYIQDGSTITNCYSIGQATGTERIGGLVGHAYSSDASDVTYSYWDTTTSGTTTSSRGEGKTTSEMQDVSTFTNWDSINVWNIIDGEYPYLK